MTLAVGLTLGVAFLLRLYLPRRVYGSLRGRRLAARAWPFLVLGLILGLILDVGAQQALVTDLTPLLCIATGWLGLAAGLRMQSLAIMLSKPGLALTGAELLPAALVALLGGGALLALDAPLRVVGPAVLILAAAAPQTTALLLRAVHPGAANAQRARRGIVLAACAGTTVAFALGGGAVLLTSALYGGPPLVISALALVALVALVVLCLAVLLPTAEDGNERTLFGLGLLALASGAAIWLALAPSVVGFLIGIALVSTGAAQRSAVSNLIKRLERPVSVVLLVAAGLLAVQAEPLPALALFGALIAAWPARSAGLRVISAVGIPATGVTGLVLAMDLYLIAPGPWTVVVLAAVVAEGLANALLRKSLNGEGAR